MKIRFAWAIDSSIEVSEYLASVRETIIRYFDSGMMLKSSSISNSNYLSPHVISNSSISFAYSNVAAAMSCCSEDTIQALKCIRDLSKEFDIRISLETYLMDESSRRGILSRFAKGVFKYGAVENKLSKVSYKTLIIKLIWLSVTG